jgi:hypothetical protein
MKRGKTLLILSVLVIGLIGTYLALKNSPAPKEPAVNTSTPVAIAISTLDKTKITQMTLQSDHGKLTFRKKPDRWIIDSGISSGLDQSAIEMVATSFGSLTAEEVIEKSPKDLGQFGLTPPVVTAVAVLSDGTSRTIYIGDATPASYGYYAMVKDDPAVYRISGSDGSRFRSSLNDFRDKSLPVLDYQQCVYFKLVQPEGETIEIVKNPSRSAQEMDYNPGYWKLTQPYQETLGVSIDRFNKDILTNLASLAIDEYLDDQPKDPNKYGLASPRYRLTVKDQNQSLELLVGNEYHDDYYYCMLSKGDSVFTVRKDTLNFLDVKPFDLVDKVSYIVNIDNVDQVTIETGGQKHTMTLTRKIKKKAAKDKPAEYDTTYRVDGKRIGESLFKSFYRDVIGLTFEADHRDKIAESAPAVTVVFHLNTGKERKYRISYVPYNRDFYAIFRNGHSEFLISKDQVGRMLDNLDLLLKGKLKPSSI